MSEVPLPTSDTRSDNVDIVEQSLESLQVVENAPLDVSGAGVPLDTSNFGPYHDRVTGAATNATVNPGVYGGPVTVVADTSGTATLTIGVSNDGANWSEFTVSVGGSGGAMEEVAGFAYVRASVDQNLNSLELSTRGV